MEGRRGQVGDHYGLQQLLGAGRGAESRRPRGVAASGEEEEEEGEGEGRGPGTAVTRREKPSPRGGT